MVKCQKELLLFSLLLLIAWVKGGPSHSPWGLRSLSGPSGSIPSLHYESLADSSSCLPEQPQHLMAAAGESVFACVFLKHGNHFPKSIYFPGDICHSNPLQRQPVSKPLLLLLFTWNLHLLLAQLRGSGSSSNSSFTRESSWISPVQ